MATAFATKQRLNDAREALHNLQLGRLPRVVVDQNGEKVEFNSTNLTKLQGYILQLEQDIANGCGGVPAIMTRPAGFLF